MKHDVGVPDPFQQGGRSESSLGVSVRLPTTLAAEQRGADQYTNIAEVGEPTAFHPVVHPTVLPLPPRKLAKNSFQ